MSRSRQPTLSLLSVMVVGLPIASSIYLTGVGYAQELVAIVEYLL